MPTILSGAWEQMSHYFYLIRFAGFTGYRQASRATFLVAGDQSLKDTKQNEKRASGTLEFSLMPFKKLFLLLLRKKEAGGYFLCWLTASLEWVLVFSLVFEKAFKVRTEESS